MESTALASAAVAAIVLFLGKVADGAGGALGKMAVEKLGPVLNWVRTRARGETAIALARLEAAPADAARRSNLETALSRQLEDSPTEVAELRALLQYNVTFTLNNRNGIINTGDMQGVVGANASCVSVKIGNRRGRSS